VGGIGMGSGGMVTPEHPPCRPGDQNDHHNHDTFFELQGPSGAQTSACDTHDTHAPHTTRHAYATHTTHCSQSGAPGTDVHHHFVQRWNGALDHHLAGGHWPSLERANSLPFPSKLTPPSEQGTL
jgi:phosphatidylserine/phosphatidylglycerophosphate/cardiolipin synthase-like enzyme